MIPIIILCGGLGTRVKYLDPTKPKCMLDLRGRPFLEYVVEKHYKEGFRNFALCVGYLAEKITEHGWKDKFPLAEFKFFNDIKSGKSEALNQLPYDRGWVINGDTFNPTPLPYYEPNPCILVYNNKDAGVQYLKKNGSLELIKIISSNRYYDIGTVEGFKEFEEYLDAVSSR